MKFRLLGENSKVEIDVLDRGYPNSSDYFGWKVDYFKRESRSS